MSRLPAVYREPAFTSRTIDLKALHPGATFLRILGVNYVHLPTSDGGDLYVTEHGIPFVKHLNPRNWFASEWFAAHAQRLAGTSTVYKLSTRPVEKHATASIDLVVKWSRVGQDTVIDTMTLQRNVNAEFNSPFEEFARVEELRHGGIGPKTINIMTQRPMAIFVPSEQMQLWQTGRSRERVLARVARHPGIAIDVLRAYIMLYGWIEGVNAVEAMQSTTHDIEARRKQLEELTRRVDRELAANGFIVADHKPTHFIVRFDNQSGIRCRNGEIAYALVDFELLSRTVEHENVVRAAKRREYLQRQKDRFQPRSAAEFPAHLKPARVLDVDYVVGRAESTGGTVWVVGNDPELFAYFRPERWRTNHRVKLAIEQQTYYVQTKDRVHLVWKASRIGEIPPVDMADPGSRRRLWQGYNSPFEEFALVMKLMKNGCKTVYPRAIYMTAATGQMNGRLFDDRRFKKMQNTLTPLGTPIMPVDHDYVTLWGFWRGLEDDAAIEDTMLWTPIDVASAAAKGIIEKATAHQILRNHADQLANAGFRDSNFKADHVLISYVPSGSIKQDRNGQIESRQCNFEMVMEL